MSLPSTYLFEVFGIVGSVDKPIIRATVNRLRVLLEKRGKKVYVEQNSLGANPPQEATLCSVDELGERCQIAIVVGGDGSLLHAARDLVDYDIPILGVNRGRLGFLTDILPAELETCVDHILRGEFAVSERFMLNVEVHRDGQIVDSSTALNDLVLQSKESIRLVEFELKIGGQFVYNQRSDGLIVSTPTGSTAYALSGGGSIIHPDLNAFNVVPINAHTLSSRPILVSADTLIEIDIVRANRVEAHVMCDGQVSLDTQLGDKILIRKHAKALCLLHPKEHDFYATCRTKLNWERE